MPSVTAHNTTPHAVLRGVPSDDPLVWRLELREISKATGCFGILFPAEASRPGDDDLRSRYVDGTWQQLAYQLQVASAIQILTNFISGRVWALMLTNRPGDANTRLLADPAEAMSLAWPAAAAAPVTPVSERQKSRLLFELNHGDVDDYPSEEHFRDAMEWLEVVVHLSADEEAVNLRRTALNRELMALQEASARECAEVEGPEEDLDIGREHRRSLRRPREQADLDGGPELPRRVRNKREG